MNTEINKSQNNVTGFSPMEKNVLQAQNSLNQLEMERYGQQRLRWQKREPMLPTNQQPARYYGITRHLWTSSSTA